MIGPPRPADLRGGERPSSRVAVVLEESSTTSVLVPVLPSNRACRPALPYTGRPPRSRRDAGTTVKASVARAGIDGRNARPGGGGVDTCDVAVALLPRKTLRAASVRIIDGRGAEAGDAGVGQHHRLGVAAEPVSSRVSVVAPPPVTVSSPLMLSSTPPSVGRQKLPTVTVSVPEPVVTDSSQPRSAVDGEGIGGRSRWRHWSPLRRYWRSRSLSVPLPVVMDWSKLKSSSPQPCRCRRRC